MPAFLKDLKKIMRKDKHLAGKNSDGSYKAEIPQVLSRDVKDYTILSVSRLDISPNIKDAILEFEAVVASENTAGVKYRVILRFHDFDFQTVQTDKYPNEEQVMKKGKKVKIYYATPTIRNNAVSMKCTCKDFRHRWSHQLADVDSLVGNPIPYTRLTPEWPVGNPYANATDKQGFCKHVHSMVEYLKGKKLIKE